MVWSFLTVGIHIYFYKVYSLVTINRNQRFLFKIHVKLTRLLRLGKRLLFLWFKIEFEYNYEKVYLPSYMCLYKG